MPKEGSIYVAFSGRDMWAASGADKRHTTREPGKGFIVNAHWYPGFDWRTMPSKQHVADHARGQRIAKHCTTTFHAPDTAWKRTARGRIARSRCMVALLGQSPETARQVVWEIHEAMRWNLPLYVMKRGDSRDRYLDDDQVTDFLDDDVQDTFGDYRDKEQRQGRGDPGDRCLEPYSDPREQDHGTVERWDPTTWVYPGLSRFLDHVHRTRRTG